jgi:hypothetical protein
VRAAACLTAPAVAVAIACAGLPFGSGVPLGASPGLAAAAQEPRVTLPPSHVTRFELRGSRGYDVVVSANDRNYVTVKATRHGARTEYVTRGRPTDGLGGQARFGGLGSVGFGFRPTGRARQLPRHPGCDRGPTVQKGIVRGLVEFTAERGFTEVSVRRARAELVRWPRLRCRVQERAAPRDVGAQLFALTAGRLPTEFTATRFAANARPRGRRVQFEASAAERLRGVRILRAVSVAADTSTFRQPEPETVPEHLVLTPPAPFSGSASFQRTPESTFTWTGPLRVEFPGASPTKLTGPGFAAGLCALRGCAVESFDVFFR